jgi:hypothetical protein
MERWKQNNIKTTVSLPVRFVGLFKIAQRTWLKALDQCLADSMRSAVRRDRARYYNHEKDRYQVVPVYWPIEVYNKLHALAAAQRVSVSLLVYTMIIRLLSQSSWQKNSGFNNYSMIVKEWSPNGMHIEENIQFYIPENEQPPPEEPPLAA